MQEIVQICTIEPEQLPSSMSHATELAKLKTPELRAEVWQRVLAQDDHRGITAKKVQAEVTKKLAELDRAWITLAEWNTGVQHCNTGGQPKFNQTNDNIEWAAWSWNPVTGCKHDCRYCYARDIANRFYPHGFEPTYHPGRLLAPMHTKHIEPRWEGDQGHCAVFVCSMADLFGEWVPDEWIKSVMDVVSATPKWTYIFLTKNPARLATIDWPKNSVVGTTVDVQARVKPAETAFETVNAPIKFVSCEPLRAHIEFSQLGLFDWVLIGGQSRSAQEAENQPLWNWVEDLHWQARDAQCKVYYKTNLTVRPREFPNW
jgi:protein gp37